MSRCLWENGVAPREQVRRRPSRVRTADSPGCPRETRAAQASQVSLDEAEARLPGVRAYTARPPDLTKSSTPAITGALASA